MWWRVKSNQVEKYLKLELLHKDTRYQAAQENNNAGYAADYSCRVYGIGKWRVIFPESPSGFLASAYLNATA